MPRGELGCRCGEGKGVLVLTVYGRQVALLCEGCAGHTPTLRYFLTAAAWLYGSPSLRFAFRHRAVTDMGFRLKLETVIRQEDDRYRGMRRDRVLHRVGRAVELPTGSPEEAMVAVALGKIAKHAATRPNREKRGEGG